MIKIQKATYLYSKNVGNNDISVSFEKGKCYALLGHNGAGKSTLLKMMTGILKPQSGNITYDNLNFFDNDLDIKKNFYFVQDNPELTLNMDVSDYIELMFNIFEQKIDENIKVMMSELFDMFEIPSLYNSNMANMSHGQKQKIQIITALLIKTDYLFLDEPLVGLDAYSQRKVMELLTKKQNRCVIFSSHDLDKTQEYVDNLVLLAESKVLFNGEMNQFLEEYKTIGGSLEDIYLGLYEQTKRR